MDNRVSRRGFYHDLDLSPYEYISPYGDSFKFPSQKKLESFEKHVPKEIEKVTKAISGLGVAPYVMPEVLQILYRVKYHEYYDRRAEGWSNGKKE